MVPAFVLMSFSCELFLKALAIKNGNTVKRDVTICNKYDEKTMHIKNGVELCNTK